MWPKYASANLLQHLHRLSKACSLDRAWTLLDGMIQQHLQGYHGYKTPHLLVGDVMWVIRQVQAAERTVKGSRGKGKDQLLKVRQKGVRRENDDDDDDNDADDNNYNDKKDEEEDENEDEDEDKDNEDEGIEEE